MEKFNLENYKGGWFIGDFAPTLVKTDQFEVACKYYKKGDSESAHIHKIATEFTLIAQGSVLMNNVLYKQAEIVKINKGESTDFLALEDSITFVVKIPSVKNDKYLDGIITSF